MHCSGVLHACGGRGDPGITPLFTLKLFCGNVPWDVFKLTELKNLQWLDHGSFKLLWRSLEAHRPNGHLRCSSCGEWSWVRTPLVQVSSLFALEEEQPPSHPSPNSSRQEAPLEEEAIPREMEATGELGYEIPSGFSIK